MEAHAPPQKSRGDGSRDSGWSRRVDRVARTQRIDSVIFVACAVNFAGWGKMLENRAWPNLDAKSVPEALT